jgi:Cu+-exporting ATPase
MHVYDPVCGKPIDLVDAVASIEHEGWAYFFCSLDCHDEFKRSPGSFAEKPGTAPGNSDPRTADSTRRSTCEGI